MWSKLMQGVSKIPLVGKLFGGSAAAAATAEGGKKGMGLMAKLGLGTGAAVVADQALLDGEGTQAVGNTLGRGAEGVLGLYNRYVNPAKNNIEALDRNLTEQSTSMGWFNTINGWLFSLFDFLGMDKLAEKFKERMTNTTKEIFEHIDDQRQMLDEQGNYRRERFSGNENEVTNGPVEGNAPNGPVSGSANGEVSVGSAFGAAAYGLENGIVSMATGITSLVSGTYEALTTDKGWGASIADDFNSQKGWAMGHLDSLHGKPEIDTQLEKGLYYGGEFGSWLVPVAATAKVVSQVPQALKTFVPALGMK